MDEISRFKKTRGTLRSSITKFINKTENEITQIENEEILEQHLTYLTEILEQIKTLDQSIQKLITDEKDFETEIQAAIDYNNRVITFKARISSKIKLLERKIIPNNTATNVEAESNNLVSTNYQTQLKTIKLPKLCIEKYFGDPANWLEFWNKFQSSINNNSSLSTIDKFAYLKSLLGGVASNVVNGFSLSEENYAKALKLLENRFGRQELVVNAHMSKLLNLYPIKELNNIVGLRRLYDTCEIQIRSLESLNVTTGMYSHLLYPILIKLIPDELALEFSRKRINSDEAEFDVAALLKFLKTEIECREAIFLQNSKTEKKKPNYPQQSKNPHFAHNYNNSNRNRPPIAHSINKAVEYLAPISENNCIFCKSNHDSEQCRKINVDEKKDILRKQARCFLCLQQNHRIKDCKSRKFCEKCQHKHNTSICYQLHSLNEEKVVTAISHCHANTKTDPLIKAKPSILLQTCTALIKNPRNEDREPIRILLDSGSMRSFIHSTVSQKLKLPIIRQEKLAVYAFGVKEATEKIFDVVQINLENREDPSLNVEIEALVTDNISATSLPTPDTNIFRDLKHFKNLQLADSYNYKDKEIEILVGSDYYFSIVTGRIRRISKSLVTSETIFGWCFLGRSSINKDLISMKVIVEEKTICDQLKEFWDLESLGIDTESELKDNFEEDIMRDFEESVSFKDHRYKVKLPWKPQMKQMLDNNKEVAVRRFQTLRKTFNQNSSLFSDYQTILEDYKAEGIIEKVDMGAQEDDCYYLPHRAVIRDDKSTTKTRIVFDASSHAKGQLSLNDCLYTGLNLLTDIFVLLVQFRERPVGVTCDIKQAFLQILIDEGDRDFTRFIWKDAKEDDFQTFRFARVLFGVSSSPFLLNATIKHHLERYVNKFPRTYSVLKNAFYMDDGLFNEETEYDALKTCTESFKIFKDANMVLRKWKTNSLELLRKLKQLNFHIDEDPEDTTLIASKVLGLGWNPRADTFYFDIDNLEKCLFKVKETKRYILKIAGKLFDPIGFLGPFTIRIKCLIQEIWILGLDWDEDVPNQTALSFREWCKDIIKLREISIPRHYFKHSLSNDIENFELHLFSDACNKAYGTVAYLRVKLKDNSVITSFVASKSRVAPLKTLSLPRLELMGALLASRLSDKITKSLNFPVTKVFWTDSSITYFWIRNSSEKFKIFVKNRVKEIHKYSNPSQWNHCPGKENPADLISRGLSVTDLKNSNLWWQGPHWLKLDKSAWPKKLDPTGGIKCTEKQEILEIRTISTVTTIVTENSENINNFINRYSSFSKLIRVTAYLLRFIDNCKAKQNERQTKNLSATELKNATNVLVKRVQESEFSVEIKCLRNKQPIPKNSKILSLNVFLDENGFLKVGGRLKFSELPETQKHQQLLPKSHHFTKLLIEYYHKKSLHSGTQTTLYLIRQFYWIPFGLERVRRVINKCLTCFKTKNKTINQIMGDLPRDRIVPSRPFEKVGLDYAGPIITKPNLKRSRVTLKSYIAIFICFCTKATHFEVVSDLTTEAFLASFRRFIARRGRPSVIWSDNGTNFKGAKNVLDEWSRLCGSESVQAFSADEGIKWNFIPPASPHFGGLWEANIKSMKNILLKVTKTTILNFEELTTLVTQIEAILNSRPLSPLSSDPKDLNPLTPGHFLTGAAILSFPEPITVDSFSFLSRWELVQSLRNRFWSRWNVEYLQQMQTRSKWRTSTPNLKVGQLVLLKETGTKPFQWPMARVTQIFPGDDGKIRVVELRTATGNYRRTITKLVPLPFDM